MTLVWAYLCRITLTWIERSDFFYNIGHVGYIVLQPVDDKNYRKQHSINTSKYGSHCSSLFHRPFGL